MQSDHELATRIVEAGDEDSFRTLYRRHTPRLFQMLLRLMETQAEAEDAAQETWLRAVETLPQFRWESAFQTWLIGIGVNVARNLLRGRRDEVSLTEDAASTASSPDVHIDLEYALTRLPPGQRMTLLLHDLEGWTHEEIAARVGVTPGTSKSQLFDARRAMRALLDPGPPRQA